MRISLVCRPSPLLSPTRTNRPQPRIRICKDFKSHQTLILAGLGFSRLGNQTKSPILPTGIPGAASSPERFRNLALKADERFFGGYDPKKEPLKVESFYYFFTNHGGERPETNLYILFLFARLNMLTYELGHLTQHQLEQHPTFQY
ncbi:hypothetical protein PSHT_10858 [Puccinia striiformis]|uniref:Uncharacterized protein n=1 Tax=Puccinia striiformis TaxID=27350 RepID=A0A2S4V6W9_9BASI|nr:hypothetical protein PSHT_10858 [Puccinia striiformis]